MLLGEMNGLLMVLIYDDRWAPLHGRLLAPKGRYRPSSLKVCGYTHSISLFVKGQDMLGLNEVCNISLAVDTSHNKAATWTTHILFGNQSKVEFLLRINLEGFDLKIPEDARDLERGEFPVFKIFQQVIVKDELWDVVHAIRIFHCQGCDHTVFTHPSRGLQTFLDRCLNVFAEVNLVRKIESFLLDDCLNHFNKWLSFF